MTTDTLTTYQQKALITRKRRAAADKRFAAEVAARRVAFQAKLDAIVAAKQHMVSPQIVRDRHEKAAEIAASQAVDSELYTAEDGIEEDYLWISRGC